MATKIAHICTSRLSYKILEDKLIHLSRYGSYDVHLISSGEGQDSGMLRANGITQHEVEMNRSIHLWDDLKSIVQMSKLLKRERFDIVHTHTAKAGIIGRIAAKICNVPLIIHTAHGLPFFEGQQKVSHHLYKYLEILSSACCHFIASQNMEDVSKLSRYIRKSKLVYEGNGIDLEWMDRESHTISESQLADLKERHAIPQDKKIILVGARFEPVKDHALLLRSLEALKNQWGDQFCCLLAGNGMLEEEIRNRVKEQKLSDQVIFLGYQTNMLPWIKMADLLMLTSQKEGIPRILMEGMGMAKPVVATDVLGTRELVEQEKTGFLAAYGNAEQLAGYAQLLLSDAELQSRFGLAGRRRIEEHFTVKVVLERMHRLYQTASRPLAPVCEKV